MSRRCPRTPGSCGDAVTDELWTEKEVSDRFRIPLGTLRYWRHKRAVLPYRKLGALVRYDPAEVRAAIDTARVPVG